PVTVLNPEDIKKLQAEQEKVKPKEPTILKTEPRKPTRDVTSPLSANNSPANGSPQRPSFATRPQLALPAPTNSSLRIPLTELKEKYYLTLAEAAQLSGL